MTRLDAWQCDVCKKVFTNSDEQPGFKNSSDIALNISSPSQYFPEVIKSFQVCLNCRTDIVNALEKIILDL